MKTDMSPEAVTARLKKTSELRRLCISLGGDRLRKKLGNTETLSDQMQQHPDKKKLQQG
ncbi:MAG: hypothetical protein SD837_05655 [Candidatus Electrothrix scaldis]|nr:MAG: hypothetical protein SD837_05655 [Candidatus Electrothrix sp. GW3-3]